MVAYSVVKHPQQETLLQVDVKELKGRPGAQEMISEAVAAPADFATVLVGIPQGSDLQVDIRMESVHEGVLVTGTTAGEVAGECGRCLDPLSYPLTVDIMQLYTWPDRAESEAADDDEDTHVVSEDLMIDLEPVLRDLIVSSLPFQPVCRENCAGLCSQCGFRMEEDPEHAHEQLDPRWAALADLAKELHNTDEDGQQQSSSS